jgi:hypothetical protein
VAPAVRSTPRGLASTQLEDADMTDSTDTRPTKEPPQIPEWVNLAALIDNPMDVEYRQEYGPQGILLVDALARWAKAMLQVAQQPELDIEGAVREAIDTALGFDALDYVTSFVIEIGEILNRDDKQAAYESWAADPHRQHVWEVTDPPGWFDMRLDPTEATAYATQIIERPGGNLGFHRHSAARNVDYSESNASTVEAGDWQDRLIAAAATVTVGPRATSEPVRVERLPSWINFEGIIDVEAAERRFELARQGRVFLPALAAWKREVLGLLYPGEPQDFGDAAGELFWGLSGVRALGDMLLEVGWVGGDNESQKAGTVDVETLDAYAAEVDE